jgi:hypothetical protein
MQEMNNYIKSKRLELSSTILNRKIIYLDTKYWIKLREQNKCNQPNEKKLLNLVTDLVESNKCIFPISEASFWEFFKQGDIQTLRETVQLVDKFSKGISIIPDNERIQLEFIHFVREKTGKEVYNMNELVWTKIAFILLPNMPTMLGSFPLQKSFYDFTSKTSLLDIVNIIENNGGIKPFTFKDNIETLNKEKEKYKDENKSFKQMFLSEIGGHLNLFQDALNEAMFYMYQQDKGKYNEERDMSSEEIKNFIYDSFKKNKIKHELPSLRIFPELFASVRWNKERKYSDGNDTIDFLHASYALPYCDYFFTEKELRTIISQRKLDSLYNCVVESEPKDVLKLLESIK